MDITRLLEELAIAIAKLRFIEAELTKGRGSSPTAARGGQLGSANRTARTPA